MHAAQRSAETEVRGQSQDWTINRGQHLRKQDWWCPVLSPFLPRYWYNHWWEWLHFSLSLMLMGNLFVSCFLDNLFMTLVVWLVDFAETMWDGQVIGQWEASCPVCTACLCGHKGQRWLSQIAMAWLLGSLGHSVAYSLFCPLYTLYGHLVIPGRKGQTGYSGIFSDLQAGNCDERNTGLPCRQIRVNSSLLLYISASCCSVPLVRGKSRPWSPVSIQ